MNIKHVDLNAVYAGNRLVQISTITDLYGRDRIISVERENSTMYYKMEGIEELSRIPFPKTQHVVSSNNNWLVTAAAVRYEVVLTLSADCKEADDLLIKKIPITVDRIEFVRVNDDDIIIVYSKDNKIKIVKFNISTSEFSVVDGITAEDRFCGYAEWKGFHSIAYYAVNDGIYVDTQDLTCHYFEIDTIVSKPVINYLVADGNQYLVIDEIIDGRIRTSIKEIIGESLSDVGEIPTDHDKDLITFVMNGNICYTYV